MIARYTRPELGAIWSDRARMERWRQVEVAACEELPWLLQSGGQGPGPSEQELAAIRAADFSVEAVAERERQTGHDLAAFVDVLGAAAGAAGRWVHYGLTSSDVLDTALALQLRAASEPILAGAKRLVQVLAERAREHAQTLCVGRTHGIHAEPTTFGCKLAGFAFEAHRNAERLQRAFAGVAIGAISGPVGTYSATGPEYERRVLARLELEGERHSTQVIPRDRHAELLCAIALAGAGIERLGTEIRHLQRTEVSEALEPFGSLQKGSSAMPHKRNPIGSEQLCGLARLLRGNALAALEDVALWHERDISHSSVERVILPDATILLDYLQERAIKLVAGLEVDAQRMAANLELTGGGVYSAALLLALVRSGMERDRAYRVVQQAAMQAREQGRGLRECLPEELPLSGAELDQIFDPGHYVRHVPEIIARLDAIAPAL
ncbi:MAG TPA: adenylosuccinate lyase [Solirubrobacteraceae bacterium]|nr:adenylosuccinate lyase [Solirubrobacteraceae bacterium]